MALAVVLPRVAPLKVRVTLRPASALPTTVLSPAWPLTVLSAPPMALIARAGAMVSTAKLKGSELIMAPLPLSCTAMRLRPAPWPSSSRSAAVRV